MEANENESLETAEERRRRNNRERQRRHRERRRAESGKGPQRSSQSQKEQSQSSEESDGSASNSHKNVQQCNKEEPNQSFYVKIHNLDEIKKDQLYNVDTFETPEERKTRLSRERMRRFREKQRAEKEIERKSEKYSESSHFETPEERRKRNNRERQRRHRQRMSEQNRNVVKSEVMDASQESDTLIPYTPQIAEEYQEEEDEQPSSPLCDEKEISDDIEEDVPFFEDSKMIASEFKDIDGFRLQFEESVPDDERTYYMRTFLRVDDVAKDRVHCTTCDGHVGTAPISEKIIRTHQILGVTQCNKCFAFYNSGEFGKGEDGSEYYCRWCGQGGEVFCCSTCPFVFCNKCIKDNLTTAYIKEIERNDDWSCFVCNKETLKRLRAQHWALRNFMNKQLEKIQNVNINSEEELNNMLNDDKSTCCPKKKRKQVLKPTSVAPVKRPAMNGGGMSSMLGPPAKKQVIGPTKMLKVPVNTNYHLTKPGPKPTPPASFSKPRNNDEVVCTPDIMGLFSNKQQSPGQRPVAATAPPPLIMRQNQRPIRPMASTSGTPNPIYHTVNGYQIDLNQASRQEIFRLPNGKLIQVRKQPNAAPALPQPRPNLVMHPRQSIPIRQAPPSITTSRMMRPAIAPQLRLTRPMAPQRAPAPSTSSQPPASTVFTQQNGSISVARAPQPDTPFGKAKTSFEDKIINGLEICQHTINKMITLTNSTSFKTSRNFNDLKELYIHLQYLFTYTSGKIKTLQDSLATNVEELAKYDKSLKEKEKCEEGELEIVEQKQDVIEVLSDDENDTPAVPTAPAKKTAPGPLSKKTPSEIASAAAADLEPIIDNDQIFSAIFATMQETLARQPQDQMELLASCNYVSDDQKLLTKSAVKVERLEDAKNPIIKQYMIAIQQRRDRDPEEIEENADEDDDFMPPLIPEVVMDENPSDEQQASTSQTETEDESDKNVGEKEKDKEIEAESEANKSTEEQSAAEEVGNDKSSNDTSDVVEIPSDDEETENNGKSNESEENKKDEDSPIEIISSQDDTVAETSTASEEKMDESQAEAEESMDVSKEVNGTGNSETAEEGKENDTSMATENEDLSVMSVNDSIINPEEGAEEITKIAENCIDEKEILENLISSLDEPITQLGLENFE